MLSQLSGMTSAAMPPGTTGARIRSRAVVGVVGLAHVAMDHRHDARIVLGILGRPVVRLRLRGYSGPGIWDCPITRQPPSSPRARVTPMSYGPLRRSSTSARSSIVGGRDGHPRRTFRFADIKRGWRVEDSDETSLGTVVSSGEILLTVSRGLLSSKLYLPPSAVAEVHEGVVKLNVTSEWVKAQGWDRAGSRKER